MNAPAAMVDRSLTAVGAPVGKARAKVGGNVGAKVGALFELARATKGFMPDEEGEALFAAALATGPSLGPWMEIGAWCGKSTVYLGAAAMECGALLYSLDHHRGSEENQAGWEHHDPELVDEESGRIDTLPHWRRTIGRAGLEDAVVGLIGESSRVSANWSTALGLCFIDGGHGTEPAWADYRGWSGKVAPGGLLAIHDVFPDERDGGRPPYEIWQAALASRCYVEAGETGSLRILRRLG